MRYPFYHDASGRVFKNARNLRRNLTPSEKYLWKLLRDRRFEGYKFRRQHPIGGYIADFYCHKAKLVIELDGNGHYTPEGIAYDEERTKVLESVGLKVIRVSNISLARNAEFVLNCICNELNTRSR